MNLKTKKLASLALFTFLLTTTVSAEIVEEGIIDVDVDNGEISLLHNSGVIVSTYLNDKAFSCDQLDLNLKEGTLNSNGKHGLISGQLRMDINKGTINTNGTLTILNKEYSGQVGIDIINNLITSSNGVNSDIIDTPADLSSYSDVEPYRTLVRIYNDVLKHYNSSNSKFDELQSLVYAYGSDSSQANLQKILDKDNELIAFYDINGVSVRDICLTGWTLTTPEENKPENIDLGGVILNSGDVNEPVEIVAQKQAPTSVKTGPELILFLMAAFILGGLFFAYRYKKS